MIPSLSTLPFFITRKLLNRIGLSLIERYCVYRQAVGARSSGHRIRNRVMQRLGERAFAYGSAVNDGGVYSFTAKP